MSKDNQGLSPASRLRQLFQSLEDGLFERELPLRLALLAALAAESIVFLGPPGTAKSLLARRVCTAFRSARVFDYLMGRFSTPEEIFGPVSISSLRNDDRYVRRVEGYLPDAEIVFLDEIWKASPPIQNALLTALNEKIFRNGDTVIKLPLILLVAASNEAVPDEASQAFWDRFLIRFHVEPVTGDDNFLAMLEDTRDPYADRVPVELKLGSSDIWAWRARAAEISVDALSRQILLALHAALPKSVSDRRWKKALQVLRISAFIHDRTEICPADFFVLAHCLWNKSEEYSGVVKVLREQIATVISTSLTNRDFETERDRLLQSLQTALNPLEISSEDAPVLIDGEYFAARNASGTLEFRIWQEDFEHLTRLDRLVEFFVFENGTFIHSRELKARKADGKIIWIDGEACTVVCETQNITRHTRATLDASQVAHFQDLAREIQARIRARAESLAAAKVREERNCAEHFFAPGDSHDVCVQPFVEAIGSCARISADLERALADVQ